MRLRCAAGFVCFYTAWPHYQYIALRTCRFFPEARPSCTTINVLYCRLSQSLNFTTTTMLSTSSRCLTTCQQYEENKKLSCRKEAARCYLSLTISLSHFSFFLSYLGWHTLPSHASAEACLTGWPNAQPQEGTSVVLRDTIRLT